MVFYKFTLVYIPGRPGIKTGTWAKIEVWAQEIAVEGVEVLLFFMEMSLASLSSLIRVKSQQIYKSAILFE